MFEAIARLYQDVADVTRAPSADDAIAQLSGFFASQDSQERKRA